MREEKLEKLLNELADSTATPVNPRLAEQIKEQIPHRLMQDKGGMGSINIIIDLRIGKLTAAAVIIVTMILLANIFGGRDLTGNGIYQESKLLARYLLRGESLSRSNLAVGMQKYEHLVQQGKEVVYYGGSIDPQDSNAVLMQWKLSNDKYRVVFADLREETVSAEDLIKLQAQMLQKKQK